MLQTTMIYTILDSPVGPLTLAGDGDSLHRVGFPKGKMQRGPEPGWRRDDGGFREARRQLSAYFGGELKQFQLALHFDGTEFQNRVWSALQDIPFGETISYGTLAERIGSPKASRAVGAANGANPLPIVVPCHRVIGANATLTGFGGGLETKQFLLQHEGLGASQFRLL